MTRKLMSAAAVLLSAAVFLCSCGMTEEERREKERLELAGVTEDDEEELAEGEYDLTVAFYGNIVEGDEYVIPQFEEKYGVKVRRLQYTEDEVSELDIKLMAGDNDIDVFYTMTLDIFKYLNAGYYTDLSQYDTLKERLDGNAYAGYAAEYNGGYFGIPARSFFFNTETDAETALTENKYCFRNIDALGNTYLDENGDELYEVLKYLYSNPDDPKDGGYYDFEYKNIADDYFILNPYSENKELAVKYLEMVFDLMDGELPAYDGKGNQITPTYSYPDVAEEDLEGAYRYWNSMVWLYRQPIHEAVLELPETDGSDEAIRRLAEEAAAEVVMRMNE